MSVPKFVCSQSGLCCSKIGGFISEEDKKFISEFGYGKLPLIQLVPPANMTFPLWDYEAKRFREFAKNVKIDPKISPSRGLFDLDSNQLIVFTYQMNGISCPFLASDGKCKIYNTKRAFICHLFPFNKSPFLETGDQSTIFGDCPQVKNIQSKIGVLDNESQLMELYNSFGDAFLAVVEHDYILNWTNELIIKLMKEKKIRPAINYPYKILKKRIENSSKIDLLDFLVQTDYISKEESTNLINRFDSYFHAKEKIKDFVLL